MAFLAQSKLFNIKKAMRVDFQNDLDLDFKHIQLGGGGMSRRQLWLVPL